MTDPRDRVITDPGIGPIDADNSSTLRSIEVVDEVAADEGPGARVYYRPARLVAISEHQPLELETVKLSHEIDPRRVATELRLPRTPIPPVPASDSGWPQAEVVLTTSQRPAAPARRWRIPAVLLTMLGALLLLVLARGVARRSAVEAPPVTSPAQGVQIASSTPRSTPVALATTAAARVSGESASGSASASASASGSASSSTAASNVAPALIASPARAAKPLHVQSVKSEPLPSSASASASAAPAAAKPKHAIY